jgi:hypothetical protein
VRVSECTPAFYFGKYFQRKVAAGIWQEAVLNRNPKLSIVGIQ